MPPVVVVDSVSKTFPRRGTMIARRRSERALDSVTLHVEAGSVVVLLGANGSGKTTLLKLVSSMLLPDAGHVQAGGYDTRTHGAAVRRQVGFAIASERSFFVRLTARENLEFFAALEDLSRAVSRRRIDELLALVGLDSRAAKLVREFSAGMYQRLAIARALLKRPSVLLLDEPSRSLDPAAAIELWQLVRNAAEHGTAVMVASHSFEEAVNLADELVLLDRGMIVGRKRLECGTVPEDVRGFYFGSITRRDTLTEYAFGGGA